MNEGRNIRKEKRGKKEKGTEEEWEKGQCDNLRKYDNTQKKIIEGKKDKKRTQNRKSKDGGEKKKKEEKFNSNSGNHKKIEIESQKKIL